MFMLGRELQRDDVYSFYPAGSREDPHRMFILERCNKIATKTISDLLKLNALQTECIAGTHYNV